MNNTYTLKTRILFFIPIFSLLLYLDQISKIWAIETLKGKMPTFFFDGIAQLTYAENNGAWGNLGGTWPEPFRSLFLIFLPVAVLIAFGLFSILNKKITKLEFWSYLLITAGGCGNLIDRIRFNYVVDFLYIGFTKTLATNIFNIADVVIMTGFALMLLHLFNDWKTKKSGQVSHDPNLPPNL